MTSKRTLVGLGAALAIGLVFAAGRLPAQPETLGKGKRAQEFVAAFNRGDVKAVAGFWAPDAIYVDQDGREVKGQAAIEKLYAKTFAEHKGAKLTITVLSAKMLTPDVGIEDGISEVTLAD